MVTATASAMMVPSAAAASSMMTSGLFLLILWVVVAVFICKAETAGSLGEDQNGDGNDNDDEGQDASNDDSNRVRCQSSIVISKRSIRFVRVSTNLLYFYLF